MGWEPVGRIVAARANQLSAFGIDRCRMGRSLMSTTVLRVTATSVFVVTMFILVASVAGAIEPEGRNAGTASIGNNNQHSSAPVASFGFRAYYDPVTGEVGTPPPRLPPSAAVSFDPGLTTSAEGLVEIPGETAGGGVKVELQGRFQSAVRARVSPDGSVRTDCVPAAVRAAEEAPARSLRAASAWRR